MTFKKCAQFIVFFSIFLSPISAYADKLPMFETKYMALGDSLTAGHGAIPATRGYPYLLYKWEVFNTTLKTNFAITGIPGATSKDVLDYQVPQATGVFQPDVITLTVGGNDLLKFFDPTVDQEAVLTEFASNLGIILATLRGSLPGTRIYISNLYAIPQIPGSNEAVFAFNSIVNGVAGSFVPPVPVADIHGAFFNREGLLLIERKGASSTEVHPTNKGYRVIAEAFENVIQVSE